MKRIAAIVRKDFLRVRWYVAVWVALALLELGLGANQLFGHVLPFKSLGDVITTIDIAEYALTFLIAGLVVQTDPVIGTRSFFGTRPISPLRLCVAKFAGVFAIAVVIPLLVYSMWWLALGFTAPDFGWAALEIATYQWFAALPAMMIAAFTDTFTRLVVWSLVLAVALVTGPLVWSGLPILQVTRAQPIAMARVVVQLLALVATVGVVAAVQLWFRRSFTSIALLIAGFTGAWYVGVAWPRPLIVPDETPQPAGEKNPELGRDVTLEFKSAEIDNSYRSATTQWSNARVFCELRGVPTDLSIGTGYSAQWLEWPSGLRTKCGMWFVARSNSHALNLVLGLRETKPDLETEQWWQNFYAEIDAERLAHGFRPMWGTRKQNLARGDLSLRSGISNLIPKLHPTYRLDIGLVLTRPRLVFEAQIRAGSWQAGYGVGLHVISSRRINDPPRGRSGDIRAKTPTNAVMVEAVYGAPALLHDWIVRWNHRGDFEWQFALIDRKMTDSTAAISGTMVQELRAPVKIGLVGIDAIKQEYPEPMLRRGDAWVYGDPDFLDHASLVRLDYDLVARIRRQVVVEHFDPEILPPIHREKAK